MGTKPQSAPLLLHELIKFTPPDLKGFEVPFKSHCQHVYSTIRERSTLPELDERPSKGRTWRTESICQQCRTHLAISIAFHDTEEACPCSEFPLHHFNLEEQKQNEHVDAFAFEFKCGSPKCNAKLLTQFRAPRLTPMNVWTLTAEAVLKQNFEDCADPPQPKPYSPLQAFNTFQSYVTGALQSEVPKKIPLLNKRFQLALGSEAAKTLLMRLGFVYEPPEDGSRLAHWRLPGPAPFLTADQRLLLQDTYDELTVLSEGRPDAEKLKEGAKVPMYRPPPGTKDMERTLGCLDYDKYFAGTRGMQNQPKDLQAYFTLGSLPDFSDKLVAFCFDRLLMYDPDNIPFYFQSLRDIAALRQSETLVAKTSLLESQGIVSQSEVEQSLQYFGFTIETGAGVSDQRLLDAYRSRIPDVGADERSRAKQALSKIAQVRNSQLLKNALSDKMENVDQALAYLGTVPDVPDDSLLAAATVKRNEDDSAPQLVSKALQIIGDARNSDVLRAEARAGGSGHRMSPQQAYAILGVENAELVDDDTVAAGHANQLQDAPGRAGELNEALAAIAEERNSAHLRAIVSSLTGNAVHVGAGSGWSSSVPITEPRGLNNIGNTCYLNSLLQYLFTIKPVRDMVENFEEYREVLPEDAQPFEKKVADMKVDRAGVQRTQAFINELGKLFQTLTTTRATCAAPEVELARLTLEKALAAKADETAEPPSPLMSETMRRRSTLSGTGLPLSRMRSSSSGTALNSPTLERREMSHHEASASPPKKARTQSTVSAATTLIAEEDESQTTDGNLASSPASSTVPPLNGGQQSNANQMDIDQAKTGLSEQVSGTVDSKGNTLEPPKDKPPPVPPRPTNKAQIEEYAMQQDVQEVMGNVFHQLQWAIKPQNKTKLGNQQDIISETLWGRITEYSITAEGKQEFKSQDTHVIPGYANEPCNIYEALSVFFDRDIWDGRTSYWTIDKAPPIVHVQIPRIHYNIEKQTDERNVNQCQLPQHIYLDRFMANDEILRKRELFWRYRDELRKRKTSRDHLKPPGHDQNIAESLTSLSDWLKSLKENDEELDIGLPIDDVPLHESLNTEAQRAKSEIERLDREIGDLQDRMNEVFSSEQGHFKYGLQAVFVHRGSTRSGHWYTYMYDARGDKWRKYNDEDVEIISASRVQDEIYTPNEAVRGTTAIAVYAFEKDWDKLFEPVHRDPEPEPEPQPSAAWVDGANIGRSQIREMPPANVPYEGAWAKERREEWDFDRQVADSAVKW